MPERLKMYQILKCYKYLSLLGFVAIHSHIQQNRLDYYYSVLRPVHFVETYIVCKLGAFAESHSSNREYARTIPIPITAHIMVYDHSQILRMIMRGPYIVKMHNVHLSMN